MAELTKALASLDSAIGEQEQQLEKAFAVATVLRERLEHWLEHVDHSGDTTAVQLALVLEDLLGPRSPLYTAQRCVAEIQLLGAGRCSAVKDLVPA